MNNGILLLEEIKGLRKDMNQSLQVLQMLLSQHFKSSTINYEQSNRTLEHSNSIHTQTSTNDFINIDPLIIKSGMAQNCEVIQHNIKFNQGSLCQRDKYATKNNKEKESKLTFSEHFDPSDYETMSVFEKFNCGTAENDQENNNLLIRETRRNDAITGINDLQLHETSTSHRYRHGNKLLSESETVVSNYLCNVCIKIFPSESSLFEHANNCSKEKSSKPRFLKSRDQSGKLLSHTGEKSPNYPFFPRSFSRPSVLACNSDEKRFKCTFCQKTFLESNILKSHIRTHTGERPYKCTFCPKSFAYSGVLTTHLRRHTGEKPFKCTFCPKRFVESSNLRSHIMTHTGEKPYKCSFCPKRFSQSNNLTVHLKRHSGQKSVV